MKAHQTAIALQMATLGLASPLIDMDHLHHVATRDMEARDATADEMCGQYSLDDSDMSIAKQLWDNTETGAWFDEWLLAHENREQWPATMDKEVQNNGGSGYSCGTLGGTCNIPDDCRWHVSQGMGSAYWVLWASSQIHQNLKNMLNVITEATLQNALELPTMFEKFGEEPAADLNLAALVSSALVVASAGMGGIPAAPAVSAIVIGAFGILSQFSDQAPPDPTATITKQLETTFSRAADGLHIMCGVIFGTDFSVGTHELLGQTGNYQTAMARFMGDGKWLFQDAASAFEEGIVALKDNYVHVQRLGIAGGLIKFFGYVIAVDKTVTDAEGCRSMHSSWWDDHKGKCFYILKKTDGQPGGSTLQAHEDPFLVARDDYDMDVGQFYQVAYDCAVAHPEGGGKVSDDVWSLPADGSLPECYYNVGVIEADFTWQDEMVVHSANVDLNTGGVVESAPPRGYPDKRPETPPE